MTAKQCIYFLATETWWVKLAKTNENFSFSFWFSNSISVKATVNFCSFKVSINCCVFVQDDSISFSSFFRLFLENLITLSCQKFRICMMLFCIRTSFSQSYGLLVFIKGCFKFWFVLNCETLIFFRTQRKLGCLIIPKLAFAYGSSWDANSYLQNYRLDIFHQGLIGQFWLCIGLLDQLIPKYVPCLRNLVGWNWQMCDF